MIPQHPPAGDESKERTVRVSGDKKQIDMAREMIKEVMNQVSSWPDGFLFIIVTVLVFNLWLCCSCSYFLWERCLFIFALGTIVSI